MTPPSWDETEQYLLALGYRSCPLDPADLDIIHDSVCLDCGETELIGHAFYKPHTPGRAFNAAVHQLSYLTFIHCPNCDGYDTF
jgi:hypothetical protein